MNTKAPAAGGVAALSCAGDQRQMGEAQGSGCRSIIEQLPATMVELLGIPATGAVGHLAERLARLSYPALGVASRKWLERSLALHYPAQHLRLQGIARGAGMSAGSLLVGAAAEIILNAVSYRAPGACTAIGVTADRAVGGEPMIVKNFDYPLAALPTYLLRHSKPTDRALSESLDVTAAPLCGSHEGVNAHGLAVAYNYGYFEGQAAAPIPITTLVQELLEHCRDVGEAIARLKQRPRRGAAILMLADANGALVSVELSPDDSSVRSAADHGSTLVQANHGVTPLMAARDIPHDAVLSRWNVKALRGVRVHQSSERRHARGEALLTEAGRVSQDELATIAADHGESGDNPDDTICRHGPYWETTCSVMLLPRQRALKVMFAAPCRGRFSEHSL